MTNLEAWALKASGTAKSLSLLTMVGLAGPVASKSRWAGLTGANPEARTTWIHVGYEGEWEGHPSGPFVLTGDDFAACTAALANRKTPPQVDYGHGSLYESDGKPKPAAGYVLSVETRGADLWAEVEFTEEAAGYIKGGAYRFCSGVFVWDAPDRVSGDAIPCQLDSIGLTNRPFVEGQQAIRLTAVIGASMDFKKADIVAKLDALVDGDTVTQAQLDALVSFLKDSEAKPEVEVEMAAKPDPAKPEDKPAEKPAEVKEEKALAVPPQETPADVPAVEADGAAMLLTKIAELTGMANDQILASLDVNADQIKAAFLGGEGGSLPYSALAAKVEIQSETIAALSVDLGKYKAKDAAAAEVALNAEVEALVQAGKCHPAKKDTWLSLARKSPAEFRALSASLPVAYPVNTREAPKDAPTTGAESLGNIDAETIPKTHPKYVALATQIADPKSPYARLLPTKAEDRDAAIDRMVRNQIRTSQPISG